jgi:hypothetical protein
MKLPTDVVGTSSVLLSPEVVVIVKSAPLLMV